MSGISIETSAWLLEGKSINMVWLLADLPLMIQLAPENADTTIKDSTTFNRATVLETFESRANLHLPQLGVKLKDLDVDLVKSYGGLAKAYLKGTLTDDDVLNGWRIDMTPFNPGPPMVGMKTELFYFRTTISAIMTEMIRLARKEAQLKKKVVGVSNYKDTRAASLSSYFFQIADILCKLLVHIKNNDSGSILSKKKDLTRYPMSIAFAFEEMLRQLVLSN
jgi:hypothetical protein